jgi:hypothetical protein
MRTTMRLAAPRSAPAPGDRTGVGRAGLGVAIVAALALGTGCSGLNSQTNAFATLAEARQSGAITQGWIPEGLPPGSHDLREAHVPGTRHRWGIVNFPVGESASLRALLESDETPLQGMRCEAPARIEWWPVILRGDLNGSQLAQTGLRAYRAKGSDLVFAVNWTQGRAYYWTLL